MSPGLRRLGLAWVLLMLLLAMEVGASFLPLERSARPVLLIPALLMMAAVAMSFMDLARGPTTKRLFAVAGLLWLGDFSAWAASIR